MSPAARELFASPGHLLGYNAQANVTDESRMKISIHIPKTAGTLFADVLKANRHGRLAFFYGTEDPRTHAALRAGPPFDADAVGRLEDAGIEWVHGHFAAGHWKDSVPDPADYVVWLRDPIERIVSNYFFHKRQPDEGNETAVAIYNGEMSLEDYAAAPGVEHLFRRMTHPFKISDYGFVGITEMFADSLGLLGLAPLKGRRSANVNRDKPAVSLKARRRIAEANLDDVAVYSAALAELNRKLEVARSAPAPRGRLLSRLIRQT